MSATTTVSTDHFDLSESYNVDAAIYNQRILHVLDQAIARVTLVKQLVNIIKDEAASLPPDLQLSLIRLRNRYKDEELGDVVQDDDADVDERGDHEIEEFPKRIGMVDDDDMMRILNYLEETNEKTDFVQPKEEEEVKDHIQLFVKCLNELKTGIELHQNEDASKEKVREKYLKRCRIKNDQAKREIHILEQELVEKKSELHASIAGKNLMINRHQLKIDKIQKATKSAMQERIAESEAIMAADKNASDETMEQLNNELKKESEKYNQSLKDHLKIEKELRSQRLKVENQLAAFMQKFDQDMSEKQNEEEELQAAYESEKRKYEEIQKKLDEQEEEYDELMQEKAAYEQELLEQKLFIFILNRSARRIQRAFRAYKLRKMAKKKSKKGKKGKGKKK